MDSAENIYNGRIEALSRAIYAIRLTRHDNEPCQIEEGLFLGSIGAANNKTALKRLNITHILTVTGSFAPAHPHDFTYKVIEVADREETDLAQYFDECIGFIDEAKSSGGGVLVHCFMGKSRSVTVVLAYLIKNRGISFSEALTYVRSKRRHASPNSGFIKQLRNYEKSLRVQMEKIDDSDDLASLGFIEHVTETGPPSTSKKKNEPAVPEHTSASTACD